MRERHPEWRSTVTKMMPKPPVKNRQKAKNRNPKKFKGNFALGRKIAINTWENVKSQSEFLRRVWKSKRAPKAVLKRPVGWIWDDVGSKRGPQRGYPTQKGSAPGSGVCFGYLNS